MDPIMDVARRYRLRVIEDCAQAMGGAYKGKKVGTFGDAAAFSFFPSKNLGGFGDGGMIVTDSDEVAELARMLRAHGSKKKYQHEVLGYNSRLDELQAALLRVKLPHLDRLNEARRRVAAAYTTALSDIQRVAAPYEDPDAHHVFHQYTVRIPGGHRDSVQNKLAANGVDAAIYYPLPCDGVTLFGGTPRLSLAAAAAADVLSLPIGANTGDDETSRLVAALLR
jgi:dTDP-4-amino-4,6-dideoxygalactose transaminase